MTKEESRYLLRRYRYISEALNNGIQTAFFSIGGRKERIEITDTVKKFSKAVLKALEKEKNDYSHEILKALILEGNTDVYVITHYSLTRGSFYTLKEEYCNRLFNLCIHMGLVSEEEI